MHSETVNKWWHRLTIFLSLFVYFFASKFVKRFQDLSCWKRHNVWPSIVSCKRLCPDFKSVHMLSQGINFGKTSKSIVVMHVTHFTSFKSIVATHVTCFTNFKSSVITPVTPINVFSQSNLSPHSDKIQSSLRLKYLRFSCDAQT
jgi:hypothetical protein